MNDDGIISVETQVEVQEGAATEFHAPPAYCATLPVVPAVALAQSHHPQVSSPPPLRAGSSTSEQRHENTIASDNTATSTDCSRSSTMNSSITKNEATTTTTTKKKKQKDDGSSTMMTTPQSAQVLENSVISSYYSHEMSSSSSSEDDDDDDDVDDEEGRRRGGEAGPDKTLGVASILEQNMENASSSATSSLYASDSHHQATPRSPRHQQQQQEQPMDQTVDVSAIFNFAMEHRIFLKAALNLILELDRTAPQLGMMDPVILKAGSIKKASQLMNGVWKVKYVEIRRGMFSYYENIVSNVGSNSRTNAERGAAGSSGVGASGSGNHDNDHQIHGRELLRKDIPLEASTCTCRAVKLHQKALNFSPSGAIFELTTTTTTPNNVNNKNKSNKKNAMNSSNPYNGTNNSSGNHNNTISMSTTTIKRLWMATSREERQAWMNAINNAMVGGSVTRGDTSFMDQQQNGRRTIRTSPYRNDIRKYMKQQAILRSAKVSTEYLYGLRELLNHSLHIPVEWIRKQQQQTVMSHNDNSNNGSGNSFMGLNGSGGFSSGNPNSSFNNSHNNSQSSNCAFLESTVELSVDQLRRDLQRDAVSINGVVYRGDSSHGPERIFGALTRCIMNAGRGTEHCAASNVDGNHIATSNTTVPQSPSRTVATSDLRESKALTYARDILLAGNRTRSGGDSYFCVETLCSNADLVVLVPSGKEVQPVEITVTEDDSDDSLHNRFNDKSDWIRTKSKLQRSWRRHYVVLSEGMLSYYEGATPRPHGLRVQQVLADAVISITKKKSKESGNLIEINHDEFVVSISLKEGNTKDRLLLFDSETKLLDWVYALECVTKAKPSTDVTRKTLRRRLSSNDIEPSNGTVSTMTAILTSAQQATMDHALKVGLDAALVEKRLKNLEHRATCGVRVSVSACTEYKVCTTDPQGDDDQDTWAMIQSHFLQSFRISGGSAGRIMRGEEIVRFSVLNCLDPAPNSGKEGTLSPSSTIRSRINRRMFRNNSADHDLIDLVPPATVGASD